MDKRQALVEMALVLINQALEIEDNGLLTDAGELLSGNSVATQTGEQFGLGTR